VGSSYSLEKAASPGLAALKFETVNTLGRYAYDYGVAKADLLFPDIPVNCLSGIFSAAYLKAGLRLPSIERD